MKLSKRLALLLLAGTLLAQEEPPRVWIHAPAEDLLALFPEKGAGFLISLGEYTSLRDLARRNEAAAKEQPPLEGRLVRGTGAARVDGDALLLEATWAAVVQAEKGAEIPFALEGIALEKIAVEEGELVGDHLRFGKAGTFSVSATLSVRLVKEGDLRRAAFRLPAAAGHSVRVELPAEVEGETGPIVRAFRSGAGGGSVVAYPDEKGLLTMWWKPRAPARQLDALLSASFDTVAEIGEARVLARTAVALEVLRAPLETIELALTPGQTIRALTGKGIKSWRVLRGGPGAADRLEIRFVEPMLEAVQLGIETELPRESVESVPLPMVRVPAAVRYRGTVGVAAQPEVKVTGLDATGARRLDGAPNGALALFEVWSQEASVTARVERIDVETRAETRAVLSFREGGKSLQAAFFYTVAGQPLFRLVPRLPAGWILRQAQLDGADVPHRYEDDGRMVLDFPHGLAPGRHLLHVHLDTDEVDWVPGQGTVGFTLANLRAGLDEESGLLVVQSDPAYRVRTGTTTGLQPVGMPEVAREFGGADESVLFAWRFERPDWAAEFLLERHEPRISALVIQELLPSERVLKMHAAVVLDIQRTGVRELKISLPRGTGPLVDFQGPLIKEKRAPDFEASEDPEGTETWTLVFQKRVRGAYRLDVSFDRKFEEDAWTADAPEIVVPDAQETGFLVVHSSGATAITVERNGLREADVGELPFQPARPPLEVLAYARHPYRVTIRSRRHDPEPVVQAVALSAQIYGVLTHDGKLRCRAEYRVRNNDQAFLRFALPERSALLAALVDGEPAKPLLEEGRLKLPLPRSENREAPFKVALVYESDVENLDARGELTVARPVLDIDVLKTQYTLHLPGGYEITDHDGDLVPLSERERETVLETLAGVLGAFALGGKADMGADASAPPGTAVEAPRAAAPPPAPEESLKETLRDQLKGRWSRDKAKLAEEKRPERESYEADYDTEEAELETPDEAAGEDGMSDAPFSGDVPPGAREPADAEPSPPSDPGADAGRFVAHGEKGGAPTPKPGRPVPAKRDRPEKALLSLDVRFATTDNVVRLQSLAPTGSVTLSYVRRESHDRDRYVGLVLGLAAGVMLFFGKRRRFLRVLPAALFLLLALHFGGLSFLAPDLAVGGAQALLLLFVVYVIWRVFARIGAFFARMPKRRAPVETGAVVLLALAGLARAEEQILVPYSEDPEKVDRVFLPADEYHRLRRLAYPETAGRATALSGAEYAAVLEGADLTVRARYALVKETEDAERLPLRLENVAVVAATLDGKPANLALEEGGYVLVLSGKRRSTLELTLRPELVQRGEALSFSVPVRPVAGATLRLEHDRAGYQVEAVSLGADAAGVWQIGPVGVVAATLTPETEGFTAAEAELRADTQAFASVRDGYTAVAARITYAISGGTVARLRVALDRDLTVRAVRCADLAGWQIDAEGNLVVVLAKPAERQLVLELAAERATAREREETFPRVEPLGVLRDAGVVALDTLPDLKLELLETQGLLRGRAEDAPEKLSAAHDRGVLHSVHRYAVRPFTLRWRAFVEETRLRAETRVDLYLEKDRAFGDVHVRVEVERGPGPFTISVPVPAGWEVVTVQGNVREWWIADGVLHLDRPARQRGAEAYGIVLRRRGPTAEPFPAPAVAVRGAVRETGTLRVAVADGLELETGETANLLPEDVARAGDVKWGRLVRAYRFVSVPWRLVVNTREEPREVEALVVSRVVPLADRVLVEALVDFHVRRGLVDRFSFVVPVTEEREALVHAPDRREIRSEAVEGGRRFVVHLRTPTRGSTSATVSYHLPYDAPLRGVEPDEATRVRRFVAVEKVADGEVRVGLAENLDAGDFDDLPLRPPESTPASVARVYVGSGGPFRLGIEVRRHAFEEVAKAVIYRAAAIALVDRSGWTRVQVGYRVYNRSEQFLRLKLPKGAELYSVLVAGEGVRPLGEEDVLLVPLRKLALGSPTFDVEVLYAFRGPVVGEDDFGVALPEVMGLDVRRTTLSLWVPRGYSYDFETEMEEAGADDIVAGEATDLYEEIKELYGVAERGNQLQVGRALSNVRQLEQEAQRLMDEVRAQTRDESTLRQMDSQKAALEALRRAVPEVEPQNEMQTALVVQPGQTAARGVTEWGVNDAYLKQAQGEEAQQVQEYLSKNFAQMGENGTPMPAGGPGRGMVGGSEGTRADLEGAVLGFPVTVTGQPQAGGGAGGRRAEDRKAVPQYRALLEPVQTADAGDEIRLGSTLRLAAEAGEDRRGYAGVGFEDGEGGLDVTTRAGKRLALQTAPGRISLRIDLDTEGEVYHLASLGRTGAVSFSADEEDGRVLQGLLAVVCALVAVFALRFRRSA